MDDYRYWSKASTFWVYTCIYAHVWPVYIHKQKNKVYIRRNKIKYLILL